jgi:hypothetical protein
MEGGNCAGTQYESRNTQHVTPMNEPWSYFTDDEVFGANVKERQSIAAIRGKDDLPDICEQVTEQIRQAYIFSHRELGGGRNDSGWIEVARDCDSDVAFCERGRATK